MRFRIPQGWLYHFAERLLEESGIDSKIIEDDLGALVYEAGKRGWGEDDDDEYFYIDHED